MMHDDDVALLRRAAARFAFCARALDAPHRSDVVEGARHCATAVEHMIASVDEHDLGLGVVRLDLLTTIALIALSRAAPGVARDVAEMALVGLCDAVLRAAEGRRRPRWPPEPEGGASAWCARRA